MNLKKKNHIYRLGKRICMWMTNIVKIIWFNKFGKKLIDVAEHLNDRTVY